MIIQRVTFPKKKYLLLFGWDERNFKKGKYNLEFLLWTITLIGGPITRLPASKSFNSVLKLFYHRHYWYISIKTYFLKLPPLSSFTFFIFRTINLIGKYYIKTSLLKLIHLFYHIIASSCSFTRCEYLVLDYFIIFLTCIGCSFSTEWLYASIV